MEFFYLILLLLLFLLIKIYTDSFRIKIFFEMDQEGTRLEVFYLRPFLKVLVDIENDRPFLRIYIFNIRIARMQIQSKKRKKHFLKLIKNIKASHIRVATYYGLDPYLTDCFAARSTWQNHTSMWKKLSIIRILHPTASISVGSHSKYLYRA